MKKYIFKLILGCGFLPLFLLMSCTEKKFSEDYDINLPVSSITDFNPKTEMIGDSVTIYGENLDMVTSVSVGTSSCEILSQDSTTLIFKVARTTEMGKVSITNKYKRNFQSEESFTPQYPDVTITKWPSEIQRGQVFSMEGENMDMIETCKFGDVTLSKVSATETKAIFATANIVLPEDGILTLTTKTGQTLTSSDIPVVKPSDTYEPQPTILLWDFETAPTTEDGGSGDTYTAGVVDNGFFGKAFEVKSAAGNNWDGIYVKLINNNGGQGFDLSAFKHPYITFLVNTNGEKGYFNPAITIGGSESDKHFTGQGGEYTDDYKFITQGWEWRSYDLESMGWTNIIGKIDQISLWFRGGNVTSSDPFDIMIDQVMITDGPLNPTLIWDAEAPAGGDLAGLQFKTDNSGGLTGYFQGKHYVSYDYTVSSSPWDWLGNIMSVDVAGLDPQKYNNMIYLNFLVNTGDTEGYAGFQILQGDNKLADQALDASYGDNYKFAPTNSKWEWRSMPVDISTWDVWGGSADNFDLSQAFNFSVYARGGNIASGVNAHLNMDYFIFTSVPLDVTKK